MKKKGDRKRNNIRNKNSVRWRVIKNINKQARYRDRQREREKVRERKSKKGKGEMGEREGEREVRKTERAKWNRKGNASFLAII